MNPNRTVFPDERGFTLVEMLLVVAVMGTLAAMAVVIGPSFARQAKADSGTIAVLETLRTAREVAISQRRNVQIRFLGNNQLQTAREEIDNPVVVPARTTVLRTVVLEGRVQFLLVTGVPDTPDLFGKATATAFGPSLTRAFTSEGTLIDSNGDPLNGTVFMSTPNVANSARAITVLGTTGLMRTWRWNGRVWVE